MFANTIVKAFRKRSYILWSLMFPLVLMIMFKFMFTGIFIQETTITATRVAVVTSDSSQENTMLADNFKQAIDSMSQADEPLVTYVDDISSKTKADENLCSSASGDGLIDAYYLIDDSKITIIAQKDFYSENSTKVYVLRQISDSFMNQYNLIVTASQTNPSQIPEIIEDMSDTVEYTVYHSDIYKTEINTYHWYFYSTIVMGMIFNFGSGINLVSEIRADASETGKRINIAPITKKKIVIYGILARLIQCCSVTTILCLIVKFVLHIPLSDNIPLLAAFVVIGNLLSISIGAFIGIISNGTSKDRENKGWGFIMALVFLSGEMFMQMPSIVEKHCPILNDINPVTVMNFALFDLTYSSDLSSFYLALAKMLAVSIVFMILISTYLRRNSYAAL